MRSPNRRSPLRWTAAALRWVLASAVAWSGPAPLAVVHAQGQPVASDVDAARARLAELFGPLLEARAALDRTSFDVKALAFEMAFDDAATILARVHELVRFEPYEGLLRGPQGTLAAGGGNALDQAVLTARLLGDAGYDVEIRGARLDDAAAATLLAQTRVDARATAPLVPDLDVPAVTGVAAAFEAEATRRLAAIEADVAAASAALAPLLAGGPEPSALLEDARDYHWVVYRLGPQDAWSEGHPVFGAGAPPFPLPSAATMFQGDVPVELQHRLRFQVFLERKVGDVLEVVPVTDAWERPVANLYGHPLSFANVPDGLAAAGTSGVDAVRSATSYFFPMFEGELAPGAVAFDLTGATVPPDAAASPFGALFQSLGNIANRAGAVLGGLGSAGADEAPLALTAQWLEFTLVAPDGSETTHRRMVIDRIGPEARAAGATTIHPAFDDAATFEALQSLHAFMLEPGRYGPSYRAARNLDAAAASETYLQDVLDAMVADQAPPSLPIDVADLEEEIALLNVYALFDDAVGGEDLLSYRPSPALVVLRQGLDGGDPSVDVVANPRRTLRVTPAGPVVDAAATLRAGVWETRTEGLVLTRAGGGVSPAFGALGAAGGAELRALEPDERGAVAALPLPATTRAAIEEDLARGYRVLAPTAWDGDAANLGWWRVDPSTGETLGRGLDGRGAAFVEYLTSFEVSITITAGFAVYGAHQCTKIADARTAGCCLVQNVAMAAVGTAIGVAIGAALVTTAAKLALFGAMDVGYNVGGLFVPTFCPGG